VHHTNIGVTVLESANSTSAVSPAQDIVDTLLAAGNFKILSDALKAADLVGRLKGTGPYTVFAPTDEAFRRLPAGTIEGLLKDKVKLAATLGHHIVSGRFMVTGAKSGDTGNTKTTRGDVLNVSASSEGGTVVNARVTKIDIDASNGVIHSIDRLVLPL
jgi:uncharacterized surface protein with fasciclin (FAS1) repeats